MRLGQFGPYRATSNDNKMLHWLVMIKNRFVGQKRYGIEARNRRDHG